MTEPLNWQDHTHSPVILKQFRLNEYSPPLTQTVRSLLIDRKFFTAWYSVIKEDWVLTYRGEETRHYRWGDLVEHVENILNG